MDLSIQIICFYFYSEFQTRKFVKIRIVRTRTVIRVQSLELSHKYCLTVFIFIDNSSDLRLNVYLICNHVYVSEFFVVLLFLLSVQKINGNR